MGEISAISIPKTCKNALYAAFCSFSPQGKGALRLFGLVFYKPQLAPGRF